MALGDAIKKQGTEAHAPPSLTPLHVLCLSNLQTWCFAAARRKSIAQKSEPCASLLVRLRPPQSAVPFLIEHDRLSSASSGDNDLSDTLVTSGTDDSHSECEAPTPWPSAISEEPPPDGARKLKLDSNFDRIHRKLVQEWYYIGASLFSIIAVDTTVFGFSSGNLFDVDSVAKRALRISSVASALGLFVDVWLIFVYSGADGRKFQSLAVDLYGSYFFFALSSRFPFVALFVAVLALVVFLGAIAWIAWHAAVLVMCVLAADLPRMFHMFEVV
ncbi:hypothetical protein EDB92DRAFT_2113960 [Lactarius akahatsu]|uniref:Uncharacterized protein n=1 Tax=Lactarius akahatsu TaxID=416441 RepID=A0AAD4LH02_9AGAM|nr:hypothetical protein EDB92DRAFT_2113960 [Lactarius akahatsu]